MGEEEELGTQLTPHLPPVTQRQYPEVHRALRQQGTGEDEALGGAGEGVGVGVVEGAVSVKGMVSVVLKKQAELSEGPHAGAPVPEPPE